MHSALRLARLLPESWLPLSWRAWPSKLRAPPSSNTGGGPNKGRPVSSAYSAAAAAFSPMGLWDLMSLLVLNSAAIALACGTYHTFCGNGAGIVPTATAAWTSGVAPPVNISVLPPLTAVPQSSLLFSEPSEPTSVVDGVKLLVCSAWLPPIPTHLYPRFSSWMLYGEVAAAVAAVHPDINVTVDLDLDPPPVSPPSVLSPVLCVWMTAIALYLANCAADWAAASSIQASIQADSAPETPFGGQRSTSAAASRGPVQRRPRVGSMQRWGGPGGGGSGGNGSGGAAGGGPLSALDRFRRPPRPAAGSGGGINRPGIVPSPSAATVADSSASSASGVAAEVAAGEAGRLTTTPAKKKNALEVGG